MPDSNEPTPNHALLAQSLATLTQQLALCKKDPNVQIAQSLTGTQTELESLKEEVVELKALVNSISDRLTILNDAIDPSRYFAEAAKKTLRDHNVASLAMRKTDSKIIDALLALMDVPTPDSSLDKRSLLRNILGTKKTVSDGWDQVVELRAECEDPFEVVQ